MNRKTFYTTMKNYKAKKAVEKKQKEGKRATAKIK